MKQCKRSRRLLPAALLGLVWIPAGELTTVEPLPRLAAALDSIDSRKIAADLQFISADELGGRDTPSNGLDITSLFLRNRLQRLGWKAGSREGYFQTYELTWTGFKPEGTEVVASREGEGPAERFRVGEDYFFHPFASPSGEVEGPVVFVGTATEAEVASLDLSGCVALCFDSSDRGNARWERVRSRGAVGLIVTPACTESRSDYPEKYGVWVRMAFRGRVRLPSAEEREPFAVSYLVPEARDRLLGLAGVPGESLQPGQRLAIRWLDRRVPLSDSGLVPVRNVGGLWPGSDPVRSKEVVIVSAHYDHVGTSSSGEIYNGADDNGTGTTALLALAEALAVHGPLQRSVLLLWVSGEEKGLLGSKAWAADPPLPEGLHAVADINMDMVGRNHPSELLITPTRRMEAEYNLLSELVERLAPDEGFDRLGSADQYYHRSDHASFARLGIPVVFLFADVHEDYHKPTDTFEKIQFDKVRRTARLVLRTLASLDEVALTP